MSQHLFLYLQSPEATEFNWAVMENGTQLVETGVVARGGSLAEKAAACDETHLILGGETLFFRTLSLKGIARKDQPAGALFQLEESLGDDPESYHVALGEEAPADDPDRPLEACLILKEELSAYLNLSRQMGLRPSGALPDFLCGPAVKDRLTQVTLGERTLVSVGREGAFAADRTFATSLEETFLQSATDAPKEIERLTWDLADLFRAAAAREPRFNLLQGRFRAKADVMRLVAPWRRAGALAAACLALYIVSLGAGWLVLERQARDTRAEAETSFRQAFPEVTRIVNLEAQLRQKLQSGGPATGEGFMGASEALFTGIEDIPSARLDSLQYDSQTGTLSATVEYGSYEDVDRLKQRLISSGWPVEEGSARQEAGRIIGELSIRSRS